MYFAGIRQVAVSIVVLAAGLIASMALIEWVQRTVSRYHPLAFEEAARNALAEGDQALAVNICTGNLHYAKNRFPSYGLCRLLRARGYFGLENGIRHVKTSSQPSGTGERGTAAPTHPNEPS